MPKKRRRSQAPREPAPPEPSSDGNLELYTGIFLLLAGIALSIALDGGGLLTWVPAIAGVLAIFRGLRLRDRARRNDDRDPPRR